MNRQAWFRRLGAQLPGWHVWYGGVPGAGWYAAPGPSEDTHVEAIRRPHRIGPYPTPQALREDARERYGWYEYCETCGVPARECGHRQPERQKDPR